MINKNVINKKSILITGGTGSFGNAMAEYLSKNYSPKKIIIFSRDELKQSNMMQKFPEDNFRFFIGDVRSLDRLDMAMRNVDIVIHAAAMKQVEISEYNPLECIKTNIIGAENIINAAIKNNVKKVIALSSDKAVSPLNLYGASKLASEKLFIAANNITGGKTTFSIVRYGNVSGSRGSVIPLYLKLVNQKKEFLPLTDKKMTRFFILLKDGVNFVLNSIARMQGGEIFIPKLKSFFIKDLIVSLSKKQKVIGIRPGEKIDEIMFSKDESRSIIEFKDHYSIPPVINLTIKKNFLRNKLKEKGSFLKNNEEYSSGKNFFMSPNEIKRILKKEKFIQ
tara:strand:+ start:5072 stop:6079 length:1008 start_codon:yes stop_codon:yes gene_type:complete